MGKGSKKARKNTSSVKVSIQELKDSRNGGQVALRGYSYQFLYLRSLFLSQKPSNNTSPDTQIIPTIKDPQIDSSYINQFAKFILPYIQQDYERELSQKDTPKESQ